MPLKSANMFVVFAAAAYLSSAAGTAAQIDDTRFADPYVGAVDAALTGTQTTQLALDAIRGVPDAALPAFGDWFERNAHRMPSVYVFTYADRIFDGNNQRGATWFFAARTRMLYDALRCEDDTVFERVAEVDMILEHIVNYVQANPDRGAVAGKASLEWDSTHDIVERPKELLRFCLSGAKGRALAIEQGRTTQRPGATPEAELPAVNVGLPEVDGPYGWVRPRSTFPEARGESFLIMERVIEQLKR